MPIPPPMNSQSARCLGDAPTSRGNHARGTVTVRPSESTTRSSSSVHAISTASASDCSTKVLMPLLHEEPPMFHHEPVDFRQFVAPKPTVVGQFHRFQPELCVTAGMGHVNVRWFAR